MTASPIINGLMIVFSISTVVVFLFPIIRLAPSWLERRLNKQIVFHSDAVEALAVAIERSHNDPAQRERLVQQHDYHRTALIALAPEAPGAKGKVPLVADAA